MARKETDTTKGSSLISASEIACWAYCPEQWRLQYGQGLKASNQAAMSAGTQHHARKAGAERVAGGLIAFGRLVAVLTVVALLWLMWRSR